jgi:predicted permease
MINDLRFAFRLLRASPGFAAAAVFTLALGIGVNSTIFTVANAVLFRPLPGVAGADDLVWLKSAWRSRSRLAALSYPDLVDLRDGTRDVFSGLAAYVAGPMHVAGGNAPERIAGQIVSGDYFAVLGPRAAAGRLLDARDDGDERAVAVIAHRLWQRRYAADPAAVGSTILLNGQPFTVVGVAEHGFTGPELGAAAEIWVPLGAHALADPQSRGLRSERDATWLQTIARLRPDVSSAQAEARVAALAARLEPLRGEADRDRTIVLRPVESGLDPSNRAEAVPLAGALLTVTGLVLLIACANVANLLLARGAARRREIGVRRALGASNARLLRQLLTESALLAAAGGAVALLVSFWAADLLLALVQSRDFQGLRASPDPRVLAFTAAAAIATAIVFGLAPAMTACRTNAATALRAATAGASRRRSRLQSALIVAQLALSLVLLSSASLSLRAIQRAAAIDLGFDPARLATLSFDLTLQNYTAERRSLFYEHLLARAAALPGVTAASLATLPPLSGTMVGSSVSAAGPDAPVETRTFMTGASPTYFETLKLPLVRGRSFDPRRTAEEAEVIVNETLARRLFGDAEPLGRTIRVGGWPEARAIVGIARDSKYDEPAEDPVPFLYLPLLQRAPLPTTTLIVRTATPPATIVPTLAELVRELDPALPVYDLRTMDDVLRVRADQERGMSALLAAFGALALGLAAVGLYGVMAYTVTGRTREIGIRLALGARPSELRRFVLRDGARLTMAGLVVGTAAALPLAPLAGRFLFGPTLADAAAFAAAASVLAATAALAAWLPAHRASRVDPVQALRE